MQVNEVTLFLGRSVEYWRELDNRAMEFDVTKLIEENAKLRAKVSFYEARLGEIAQFMGVMKCK